MKCVILCLFALVAVALAAQYTDRYDTINLDEILNNDRFLIPYIKCVLGEMKCTLEGKELKSHIQEALETNCAKCTTAQRKGTERVINHLIEHKKAYWNQLKAKFDPTNKYSKVYENKYAAARA